MDSNPSPPPIDIHEPFTTAERIQQLSQIDTDIASLLHHTSEALRSIANPPPLLSSPGYGSSADLPSTEAALENFKTIQAEFLNTLDRVDKHLKRHIYALEEAGVITLRGSGDGAGGEGAAAAAGGAAGGAAAGDASGRAKDIVARLDPDGVGRYGSLDVGQLNMASSTVERDLESELWTNARERLAADIADKGNRGDQMQE